MNFLVWGHQHSVHNTFYGEGFFFFFLKDPGLQWATYCILVMIQDQERRRENSRHECMSLGLMDHREPWGQGEHAQGKSRGVETAGLGLSLRADAHTLDCRVTPNPSPSLSLSLSSFINWVGWTSDMVTS